MNSYQPNQTLSITTGPVGANSFKLDSFKHTTSMMTSGNFSESSSSSSSTTSSVSSNSSSPSIIYSTSQPPVSGLTHSSTYSAFNAPPQVNKINRSSSVLVDSARYRRKEDEISSLLSYNPSGVSSDSRNGTLKPTPPNRTSSLRFRPADARPSLACLSNNFSKQSNFSYRGASSSSSNYSDDRNSIYSTYNLRLLNKNHLDLLPEESVSEENGEPVNLVGNKSNNYLLLSKTSEFKIESMYRSMGSVVLCAKCPAKVYTTSLKNLIQLIDWKLEVSGIPLWVFNTGMNPKRAKGLSLFLADKHSGFALWTLSQITFVNEFKWSKPCHITFRIHNLPSKIDKKKNAGSGLTRRGSKRGMMDNSADFNYQSKEASAASGFQFGVLKFDDEFECAKFYDFYRNLFTDSQNDDLFNPHFKSSDSSHNMPSSFSSSALSTTTATNSGGNASNKFNTIKCLYKKITKAAISSPVAFKHINSVPMLGESEYATSHYNSRHFQSSEEDDLIKQFSDATSISSDLTVTSHNTVSLGYCHANKLV